MKAVITEIRGNTAVLLSDDGCIVKVKNKNYELGQEVGMNMMLKFNLKKVVAFAAAACFMLVLSGGALAYYEPTTYVSFDVNPSIEYSVNMFNRVISVQGVNDDGTNIIDEIEINNLKNKSINEAVALTVDEVAQAGYLDTEGAGIVITTSSSNMEKASELAQNLSQTANEYCEKNNCDAVVSAEAVGKDRVAEAKELGVTPGKLNLVEKLKESAEDPDSIDINEWLNKPVREIIAQTEQNKEQEKNAGEETQNQEQNQNSETNGNGSGTAAGNGYGAASGNGSGTAAGNGYGTASGNGSGTASGNGYGTAAGNGYGAASSNGSGTAAGNGYGAAAGNGSGTASGNGYGAASGNGSGTSAGSGSCSSVCSSPCSSVCSGSCSSAGNGSGTSAGNGSGTSAGNGSGTSAGNGSGTAAGSCSCSSVCSSPCSSAGNGRK